MLFAIFDDSIGNTGIDARHMFEEGSRGRIDLYASKVDTRHHYTFKHIGQRFLIYIVLVQAHTDGFGIDLYEFGQGVLQAPGNRDSAALCSVKGGKLLARNL